MDKTMDRTASLVRVMTNRIDPTAKPMDRFDLSFGKQFIGREMSCDFRIESIEVSRRHVAIEYIDNHWFITDLQSTNGLYLNGIKLDAHIQEELKDGDRISFGPSNYSKFVYMFENKSDINSSVNSSVVSPKRKRSQQQNGRQLLTKRFRKELKELFDSELSCVICHELFVCSVNLNCGHTFCESCIEEWKRSNRVQQKSNEEVMRRTKLETNCCPICRQKIVSQNKVLVLDNIIDSFVNKLDPNLSEHRKRLIDERK